MRADTGRHRSLVGTVASLLLAALLVSGCSVVEVIDNIGKDMGPPAKKTEEKTDELPAVPDGSNQAKLRAYYNRKPKEVEEDPNDPIVNCKTSSGTQFMRKYDCALRGGRVVG